MADLKKLAEQIVKLTLLEAVELKNILKDEYGIEPAAAGPVMVAGAASGDAGGSLGASLAYWHLELGKGRILNKNDNMNGSYLGSEYSNNKIKVALEKKKLKFKYFSNKKLISKLSELLLKKKLWGYFKEGWNLDHGHWATDQ